MLTNAEISKDKGSRAVQMHGIYAGKKDGQLLRVWSIFGKQAFVVFRICII